jgi:hypothetical protein
LISTSTGSWNFRIRYWDSKARGAQAKDRIYWQRITLVKWACRYPPRSYFKVLILGLIIHHAFLKLENTCPV